MTSGTSGATEATTLIGDLGDLGGLVDLGDHLGDHLADGEQRDFEQQLVDPVSGLRVAERFFIGGDVSLASTACPTSAVGTPRSGSQTGLERQGGAAPRGPMGSRTRLTT